jgi:oligopeptide/dipeptide ABC transporter ATP-binding protein
MYLGRLCEVAPVDVLFAAPRHPYTRALLEAIPRPDPDCPIAAAGLLPGEPPSALRPPGGCRFDTRCPRAQGECSAIQPRMREIAPAHQVACHFPLPG